jgi:hypothetical protein
MVRTLQKKILGLILLLVNAPILADTSNVSAFPPSSVSNNLESKAIEFAKQAGVIGGISQACGQSLEDFSARVTEAINKLSNDPSDRVAAAMVYLRISQEAQIIEKKNQTIPCTKVLEDFRNLPIMQSDYKAKVIDQLSPTSP